MSNDLQFSREQLFEIRRQARIELVKRYAQEKDILNWGKILFPDKFNLPFCHELHDYLIDIRSEPFTNTEAPRNHAKTTIKCFLVLIFQALVEQQSFRHYLNVQDTADKAMAINRSIRHELESNELLREVYGDQTGPRWTDQQFVLKSGIVFSCVGAGQSIKGLNYNNVRPDYIVVDDLYDEADIENPESTEKKNKWFWGSLYPARAKSRRCSIHIQGTAVNAYDLLEKLKKQKRWKSRTFQAIKNWEKKEVLWVELNTFDSLMADLEDMGSIIFYREMQNDRRDEKASIIKRSWLYKVDGRSWEYDPTDLKIMLKGGEVTVKAKIIGNDPSIGKKKTSDSTATALVIETTWKDGAGGTEYWIEQLWDGRLTLMQRINQLIGIGKDQPKDAPIDEVRIEAIAAFDDYASEVIRKTNLPVTKIEWVNDKISVLVSKSKFFENGKVHLNKNIDPKLKEKLTHQLTTNEPKHDDLRDATLLTLPDDSASGPGMLLI